MVQAEIAFIIVNYNTVDLLQTCLASIIDSTSLNHVIVVVDNHSTDGSADMVKTQFPDVKLIPNSVNLGFPKAVNQGLKAVLAPYYFILNSDILILENTIPILYNYISQKPKVGIVAPAQVLPNGQAILSIYPFPNLRREWARNIFFTDIWKYRFWGHKLAESMEETVSVDWIMGAALFVRAEMIADIGYMDEAIFMYGEELDWCYRAHLAGWLIDFLPNAKIIHYESASADKTFSVYRYQRVVKSNYYVGAKHFGFWRLPFFVLAQLIGSLLRINIAAVFCIFGKRSFCAQVREHLAVIRMSFDPNLYKWIKKALQST